MSAHTAVRTHRERAALESPATLLAPPAERFTLIWTTPPHTFTPVARRCIESVLRWHPRASVSVLSNSLPDTFFSPLDVRVERYRLDELTRGTPAEVWTQYRSLWNRSSYFPNHEADLLRLLTLHRRGGAYVDFDVVLIRPLRLGTGCAAAVGIEAGEGGVSAPHVAGLDGQSPSSPLPSLGTAVLCNALMSFRSAGSGLLARAVDTFVREYVPLTPGLSMLALHMRGEWGAMGPLLLSRLLLPPADGADRLREAAAPSSSRDSSACILERAAYSPIPPQNAAAYFGPWDEARDAPMWERIHRRSVAVHLWNGLTREVPLRCGSLVHRLLEENAHERHSAPLPCVT